MGAFGESLEQLVVLFRADKIIQARPRALGFRFKPSTQGTHSASVAQRLDQTSHGAAEEVEAA